PAAEEDRRLDLVAVLEEALDVLLLELVVVLVDLGPELDLLDLDDLLVLLGLPGALLFLVLIAPEVHDPAHRRVGRGRYFHQVEPFLPGNRERLLRRHDSQLLPGVVDDPHLADPDPFIHPRAVFPTRASVESDRNLHIHPGLCPGPRLGRSRGPHAPLRSLARRALRAVSRDYP